MCIYVFNYIYTLQEGPPQGQCKILLDSTSICCFEEVCNTAGNSRFFVLKGLGEVACIVMSFECSLNQFRVPWAQFGYLWGRLWRLWGTFSANFASFGSTCWDSVRSFFMDWITRSSRGATRCHFSQNEVSRGGLKGVIFIHF